MNIEPIRIEGLSQFTRAMKRTQSDLPKAIRIGGNSAADIVVSVARSRVPSGPGEGGHAASSIKARSTQTAVRVSEGGARFPYMPWLDFGGRVGRKRSVSRPFIKSGRYIWAAFGEQREEVERRYIVAITDVARSAGLDVS